MKDADKIFAVPTNIVTGFLGVGKTTAILNLLAQKPDHERWAVLVNEFGEIGVDGTLLQGNSQETHGIYVREVPGGCMCCAAGLPMQIALNQLLQKARPQRLLIEPTGLGHPIEVLQALASPHYRDVLSLQKTVTLVDARNLSDKRYTEHPTFRQQIEIADIVVANKEDLYHDADRRALDDYLSTYAQPSAGRITTTQGKLPLSILDGSANLRVGALSEHGGMRNSQLAPNADSTEAPLPESGMLSAQNAGEGFESIGWRFSAQHVFNHQRLISFLSGLSVERMKGVFITDEGVFAYNLTRDALTEMEIDECMESRVEIISDCVEPGWEDAIMSCLST